MAVKVRELYNDYERTEQLYRVGQKVSLLIFAITLSTASQFSKFLTHIHYGVHWYIHYDQTHFLAHPVGLVVATAVAPHIYATRQPTAEYKLNNLRKCI